MKSENVGDPRRSEPRCDRRVGEKRNVSWRILLYPVVLLTYYILLGAKHLSDRERHGQTGQVAAWARSRLRRAHLLKKPATAAVF